MEKGLISLKANEFLIDGKRPEIPKKDRQRSKVTHHKARYKNGSYTYKITLLWKHSDEIADSNLAIISQTYMLIYSLIQQSHYRNLTQRLVTAILKYMCTIIFLNHYF